MGQWGQIYGLLSPRLDVGHVMVTVWECWGLGLWKCAPPPRGSPEDPERGQGGHPGLCLAGEIL